MYNVLSFDEFDVIWPLCIYLIDVFLARQNFTFDLLQCIFCSLFVVSKLDHL